MQQEAEYPSFTYDLMNECNIYQKRFCRAIAINNTNSLLLTGSLNLLNIHQFKEGMIKLISHLNIHRMVVTTLNFFDKGCFLSGSEEGKIIMWQRNSISSAKYVQKLLGHSYCVLNLIVNNKEDLLVSSGFDTTIKFWSQPIQNLKLWSCKQTLSEHTKPVYGLSMNEKQNKLISCGFEGLILIIEFQEIQQNWIVRQKIQDQFRIWGYRLCFINDDIFTYQPSMSSRLEIYTFDKASQKYIHSQDLSVKSGGQHCTSLFPSIFNRQKNLIVNKTGSNVNLISCIKKQNQQANQEYKLKLEQSIYLGVDIFNTGNIFGTLSQDGNFLITWDAYSNKFQFRKYKITK